MSSHWLEIFRVFTQSADLASIHEDKAVILGLKSKVVAVHHIAAI